jgi:hypothetical protein
MKVFVFFALFLTISINAKSNTFCNGLGTFKNTKEKEAFNLFKKLEKKGYNTSCGEFDIKVIENCGFTNYVTIDIESYGDSKSNTVAYLSEVSMNGSKSIDVTTFRGPADGFWEVKSNYKLYLKSKSLQRFNYSKYSQNKLLPFRRSKITSGRCSVL